MLFEVMDADKDGNLTMLEFHVGIESIAPVHSMEDMRKRLLCLGFTSMNQAVLLMDGGGDDTCSRPLSFSDFSDALKRVMISEPAEHRAIFEAVRSDPGRRRTDPLVSISELACGLAAVSPCLLLEDLRARLLKQFGTLTQAWLTLCGMKYVPGARACVGGVDYSTVTLQKAEFKKQASERLGFTPTEALNAFRLIDIDSSGEICRADFVSAMNLSMPSLIFEDCRHKVRQRYLSIDVAFRDAFENLDEDFDEEGEMNLAPVALEVKDFAEHLDKLGIGLKDTKRLFTLIDGSGTGKLTLFEFFKGTRLFTPSVMLEGVRLQLLQNSASIADAFHGVARDFRVRLDRSAFATLLRKLQVQCEDYQIDLIFDFLDVRGANTITVSEVIAALQNLAICMQVDSGVRDARAGELIKSDLAPFHKTVTDTKRRIKQGPRESMEDPKLSRKPDDEKLPRIARRTKSTPALVESPKSGAGDVARLPPAGSRLLSAAGNAPRSGTAQGPRNTYYKLHMRFNEGQRPTKAQEAQPFGQTMSQLKSYFNTAQGTLQDNKSVLSKSYTRMDCHRNVEELKNSLDPHLQEFRRTSDAYHL